MTEFEQYIKLQFGVAHDDVGKVTTFFKKETLKQGDFFARAGRFADKLSFIQSGIIRMYANLKDKEITQWIATSGGFVVDLYSFIAQTEARWNMHALTDCQLYTINRRDYEQLKKTVPNWIEHENLLLIQSFAFMEHRIFSHLSMTAEERYNELFKQKPELFNQVQLQYLATMLGMTPETLSRLRKKIS